MAQKKSSNFMHQKDGVEVGYFDNRKKQFNDAIREGIGNDPKPKKVAKKRKPSNEKNN